MPTLADLQAATPKCPGTTTRTNMFAKIVHQACGLPMRWIHDPGFWSCPTHGRLVESEGSAA